MNVRYRFLWCLICLAVASGCHQKAQRHVIPAIYYWKTAFAPTAYEMSRWNEFRCKRVYVRCFDVGVDPSTGLAKPIGTIRNLGGRSKNFQLIPVVFLTQDVLRSVSSQQIASLAKNISSLLAQLFAELPEPDEVQIDCDWTASTQAAYFMLLEALRGEPFFNGKTLSCTIRLHQVKYRLRSGIPPVDRGLLMCYNMGNLKKPGAHNSILDVPLAKDYLRDVRLYPLPLDVALPLFSWSVQFREGRLAGILRDVPPEIIQQSSLFSKKGSNLFTCNADTLLMGYRFEKGDVLRTEIPKMGEVLALSEFIAARLQYDSLHVILFHSDSLTLSKHTPDEIEAIYGAFR